MPVSPSQLDLASILITVMSALPWWVWPALLLAVVMKARFGGRRRRRRVSKSAAERGAIGEGKVASALKRLKLPALHDVLLPSREGAVTQVDHIALVGGLIVSIETKNFSGSIYARESDQQWTQVLHGGSKNSFYSPILQSQNHVKAIEAKGDYRNVRSIVVFVGKAKFPNGRPDGVIHLDEMPAWIAAQIKAYPGNPYAARAWSRLEKHHATCDRKSLSRLHMETVDRAKQGRWSRRAA